MLADHLPSSSTGKFVEDVQCSGTFKYELLDFIAGELPRWRDSPDRPSVASETDLTDQLCSYLNGAARHSDGWSRLQFRTEVGDERGKSRKIDLAVKPCGATFVVEGRRHTQFQTLLPIECKRLPTPKGKDRDEREYVFTRHSTTGGIQRFKNGDHGAEHRLAGMIAYIQEENAAHWQHRVSGWIKELAERQEGWSVDDDLTAIHSNAGPVKRLRSTHVRAGALESLEIRHLWIEMN